MFVMIDVTSKSLPARGGQTSYRSTPHAYTHEIKSIRSSQSAMIFFASCLDTQQEVVIKVLCNYEDTRYSLSDPEKRLACQIEALQWNRSITPDIYRGLGNIVDLNIQQLQRQAKKRSLQQISIENITDDIEQLSNIRTPREEYALIMECLPKERRLDYLLRQKDTDIVHEILETLIKRIVEIHKFAPCSDSISSENKEKRWGSYEQLSEKLSHNIGLFDNLALLGNRSYYEGYSWLKEYLQEIINYPEWRFHFNKRLEQKHIKRCHGDLKARNIWIESAEKSNDPAHRVRLLDAIDFNPSYCNIDVLSDIAMLIIDVQAVDTHLHQHGSLKTRGRELGQFILDTYCYYAQEEKSDETTQLVLTYYLLEKSLVRASTSLFYDRNEYPQLGPYFLKMAATYMHQLNALLPKIPHPLLTSVCR
jgi:aminoglycoside phosphotransferase family enzyme